MGWGSCRTRTKCPILRSRKGKTCPAGFSGCWGRAAAHLRCACCATQAKNLREKEIKRQALLELVDYVNTGTGKFTEAVSEDIMFMLSNNLFRSLPPGKGHDQENYDPDEEEPSLEPAWPHLQVGAPHSTQTDRQTDSAAAAAAALPHVQV
jgi:Protein phosphatase 2A regulatory B subunit (B56 family)